MSDINEDNYWEKMKEFEQKETAEDVESTNKATDKAQKAVEEKRKGKS